MIETTYAIPTLVNFDQLFYASPNAKVVPYGNSASVSKNQAKENIQELFQDGMRELTWVASCECGKLVGNYYNGTTCSNCKTIVKTNFAEVSEYRAWLEIPELQQPDGTWSLPPVLHPVVYDVLNRWIGKYRSSCILNMILNPSSELPPTLQGIFGQGYTWFFNNFDFIMNYFLNEYPTTKKRSEDIREFIATYKSIAFVRHVPILNQALHLITSSGSMSYSDECSSFILKAKIELSNLVYVYRNGPTGSGFLDQRLWDMYAAYTEYCENIRKVKLLGKKGLVRKNLLGSRVHCSFRVVIAPQTEYVVADELHVPWLVGVIQLHHEILNLLQNRAGYNFAKAMEKYHRALVGYDTEIDEIMKTLIKECPYKGLPTKFGRNPTLRPGAIQLFFTTQIKPDFDDITTAIPPSIIYAPNADFDGDCLYGSFLKEMDLIPEYMKIHPMMTMLGGREPGISGTVALIPQAIISCSEWLNDPEQFQPAT